MIHISTCTGTIINSEDHNGEQISGTLIVKGGKTYITDWVDWAEPYSKNTTMLVGTFEVDPTTITTVVDTMEPADLLN